MTLRVTLEVIPYGIEEQAHKIFTINIHNTGKVSDFGFGNVYCAYSYSVADEDGEVFRTGTIPEHNRRDGAIELVRKVTEDYEAN